MTTPADRPTTDAVWREFGDELRRFVHRRIADPDRADDVVGDILVRVHQHVHRIDSRRLTGWLYQVARSAITDEYRRHPRRPVPFATDELRAAPAAAADEWLVDPSAVEAELAQCIRPLLARLDPAYRRALELTDLVGMTQAEAARREGVSVSGMKSRVQRGRRRLHQLFQQCCDLTLDVRGVPVEFEPRHRGGC